MATDAIVDADLAMDDDAAADDDALDNGLGFNLEVASPPPPKHVVYISMLLLLTVAPSVGLEQ